MGAQFGKRQRKQVKSLCETVAVRGKLSVPEHAANAPKNHWPMAEKVGRERIIPKPEDFPISPAIGSDILPDGDPR